MRAVCGDKPHVQFGRGGLVFLSNQDLAFYLTSPKEQSSSQRGEGATLEGGSEHPQDTGMQGREEEFPLEKGMRNAKRRPLPGNFP